MALEARQILTNVGSCCVRDCVYKVVGNGNPHQSYFHKQVTEDISCGSATSCSVSKLTSYTIGYSVSVGDAVAFLTGGFDVSQAWTSGETYGCTRAVGQKPCVWVNVAHTAYTVEFPTHSAACSTQPAGPLVMKSPNKNNQGGGYYCVTGSGYRGLGQGYWQ